MQKASKPVALTSCSPLKRKASGSNFRQFHHAIQHPTLLGNHSFTRSLLQSYMMKEFSSKRNFNENVNFVKPLYKRVSDKRKSTDILKATVIGSSLKLRGHDINIKRKILLGDTASVGNTNYNSIPGACDLSVYVEKNIKLETPDIKGNFKKQRKVNKYCVNPNIINNAHPNMLGLVEVETKKDDRTADKCSDIDKINKNKNFKVQEVWLRMYPAPKTSEETVCSVVFRCIACQLGLAGILILWTLLWMFVIQMFEGPHEKQASLEFEKEQDQLVIDLATELRQITPISTRWRQSIERRIHDEREMTILAVAKGARLRPGSYWNLPGTFLFTIYVMTALGFGAPVPQTVWGRTSALVYAIISVPAHIYLMVNLSTFIIVRVEQYMESMKIVEKSRSNVQQCNTRDSLNRCRIPENAKANVKKVKRNFFIVCRVLWIGRGVPLAVALYYVFGVIFFGILRDKQPLDIVMFPLQFTTGGGLELVEDHIRVLYGFYVEGAMVLVSCTLAALRRHSSAAANCFIDKYRLFEYEYDY